MRTDIRDRNSRSVPVTITAVTATVTGATTGTIGANATFVNVTCDTATKIVILPVPKREMLGKTITIVRGATNAFELRSNSPTTVGINATVGANVELACAANTISYATLITMTDWKVITLAGGITGITYGTPDA